MVLVTGPFAGSPITTVEVERFGGTEGTFHLTSVFGVEDKPEPSTVGVRHVSVCVTMLVDTFGAVVFWITGITNSERQ